MPKPSGNDGKKKLLIRPTFSFCFFFFLLVNVIVFFVIECNQIVKKEKQIS